MSTNYRRPKPGVFGTQLIHLNSGQIGGALFQGGASPLTPNTTTIFRLPTPPIRSRFYRMGVSTVTVPIDADGTILVRAMKYNAATDAQVQVSADLNMEALVTRELSWVGVLPTATDANLTFNGGAVAGGGDTLEVNIVNNSAAIDTQPAGFVITITFLAID